MVVLRHRGGVAARASRDGRGRGRHACDVRLSSRSDLRRREETLRAGAQGLLRAWCRGYVTQMLTRASDKTWTFGKSFRLKGVDRELPAGSYRVTTDEELVQGLSFPVYRRVSTMIFVPGRHVGSLEMLTVDPL